MTSLARGQNAPLPDSTLAISIAGVAPGSVDLFALQLTDGGRVRSDADLVFFNSPTSPEGAVRLTGPAELVIDPRALPADVSIVRLAVALDDGAPGSLAAIGGLGARIGDAECPATGLTTERAAVLAEVYRRAGAWKVRNVSAGWDAGLVALLTEHGVTVDGPPPAPAPSNPPPAAPPAPAPSNPPPAVSLSKITLTKSAPTVSLAKSADRPTGTMRVNLNWTQGKRGMFGGGNSVDLDLACLYELRNGDKGVVQALGKSFGNIDRPPFIQLDADDRSGQAKGGENLHINLAHLDDFVRILVFAFIYEGAPNWASANGVVTLFPPGGPEVEVRLDNPDRKARSCAIALLRVDRGDLSVTREVQYINGSQQAVSEAYRWGLRWTPGRK